MIFSKLFVIHSAGQRYIRNIKSMAAPIQQRYSSIPGDKIDHCGKANTYRKYATIKVKAKEQEVFFQLDNRTSTLANKVALVAGGSHEMGILCVKNLLSSGAKAIMLADTDEEEGRNVICELSKEFGENRTAFIKTDLANIKLLRNAFNWTKKHFRSIDIVVNIARPVQSENWQEQLEKNVAGIVRGTLLGIEYMGRHHGGGGGCVFNMVTSDATDVDACECPVFVGARHFAISFGRSMARRYAEDTGVKVVTLCVVAEDDDSNRNESTACDFSNLVLLAKSGSVWTT